mgnify:CR=1 FL=1
MKYKDLYDYLEVKCDFKEKIPGDSSSITWKCKGFDFTEEFCKDNNIDFSKLKKTLNKNGGYCDCEVLFNVTERIKGDKKI